MNRIFRSWLTSPWFLPLVFGLAGLLVWEIGLLIINPDGFVLPRPTEILSELQANWDEIYQASRNTGFIIVTSLFGGVILGVIAALIVT